MPKFAIFTSNNCRIEHRESPKGLIGWKVVENPDLSDVVGTSPEFWKPGPGSKVIKMTDAEILLRRAHLKIHGADNAVHKSSRWVLFWRVMTWVMLAMVCVAVFRRIHFV